VLQAVQNVQPFLFFIRLSLRPQNFVYPNFLLQLIIKQAWKIIRFLHFLPLKVPKLLFWHPLPSFLPNLLLLAVGKRFHLEELIFNNPRLNLALFILHCLAKNGLIIHFLDFVLLLPRVLFFRFRFL